MSSTQPVAFRDCFEQRFSVICEALALPQPTGELRFSELLGQMKSRGFCRERIVFVFHQLFFARLPTQEEIDKLTLEVDADDGGQLVEKLISAPEFHRGVQQGIEFEVAPPSSVLIDVSHTLRFSYNSGIQRVVRCLTNRLAGGDYPHQLIELDHALGGYKVIDSENAKALHDWELRSTVPESATWLRRKSIQLFRRLHKLVGRRLRERANRLSCRVNAIIQARFISRRTGSGAGAKDSSGPRKLLFMWNQSILFPELVAEQRCLEKVRPLLEWSECASTLILYDLIPVQRPEYFVSSDGFTKYLSLMRYVDQISCISRSVEADMRQLLPMLHRDKSAPVIETHYLGGDFSDVQDTPSTLDKQSAGQDDCSKPIVLTVGSIEVRKNHRRILRAMIRAQRDGAKFTAVFAGNPGWMNDGFLQELAHFQSQGFDIHLRQSVSEAELLSLYRDAAFTVYCSLAEGFGLPIVESVVRGTPCITSNRGCMQEIADQIGGCLLVDPLDETEMSNAIKTLLDEPLQLEALRQQADGAEWFSWADYAQSIYQFACTASAKSRPAKQQQPNIIAVPKVA